MPDPQRRLFTDRDACVVRCGHPSARLIAKPEEFLKAKHVAVVGREFTEDPVDTWLRQEEFPISMRSRCRWTWGPLRNISFIPHAAAMTRDVYGCGEF